MIYFFLFLFVSCDEDMDCFQIEDDTIYITNKSQELNREFSEILNSNPQLINVVINKTIKVLGDSCFMNCYYIQKVNITGSLKSIGNNCFTNCTNLTEIIIPKSVNYIGKECFYNCMQLKSIILPPNIDTIEEMAFCNCISLLNILVTHQVKYIKKYAFSGCINVKTVRLSPILENISDFAFENCHMLEKVILPSTIQYIGKNPFSHCYLLNNISFSGFNSLYETSENCLISKSEQKSIHVFFGSLLNNHFEIPKSIEKINSYAFSGIKKVLTLSFPDSLKYICSFSFTDCTQLYEVFLPPNLVNIESKAFYRCDSLRFVEFPQNIPQFAEDPFELCNALEEISVHQSLSFVLNINIHNLKKLRIRGDNGALFYHFPSVFLNKFKEIIINESVSEINGNVLCDLDNLEVISLPNSIKQIDCENSFINCSHLTTVSIFSSQKGNISNLIIDFIRMKGIQNVNINNSISSIHESAFSGIESLETVICEDSVVEVDNFAFSNCTQLKQIVFSQNLQYIGFNPFLNSPNCSKIAFGANGRKENNLFIFSFPYLFSNNLSRIISYLPVQKQRNVLELPIPVTEISDYSFYGACIFSISFYYNIQKIGSFAFSKSKIGTLLIPHNITKIGEYAFSDCYNLSKIKYCGLNSTFSHTIFNNCNNISHVICSTSYKDKSFCGLTITQKDNKCSDDEKKNDKQTNEKLQKFLKIYIYIVLAVAVIIVCAFVTVFFVVRKRNMLLKQQDLQKMLLPKEKESVHEPIPLPPGYIPPIPPPNRELDQQNQNSGNTNEIDFELSSTSYSDS